MISKDFFVALNELCQTKGIDKDDFMETFQVALAAAYKRDTKIPCDVVVRYNEEKNTLRFFMVKEIVEGVKENEKQISLAEARKEKKSYKVGDKYEKEFIPKDLGRIAAQSAKQIILQKIREIEKQNTISEFEDKENEIQQCIIRRKEAGTIYVELSNKNGAGQVEGVMLPQDQVPTEEYEINSKLMVYVKKVKTTGKTTQILVSRTAVGLVKRFFENEVPEIRQGVVLIKSIARDPGSRCKIAIASTDPNVDALGACVGQKGARVNAVIEALNGEKIDIIPWSEDPLEFIANALAPSKVLRVILTGEKSARVVVPDDKLSLAIGKDGQNAKLAVKLTGWKIDVKCESKAIEDIKKDLDVDEIMTQEELDALVNGEASEKEE